RETITVFLNYVGSHPCVRPRVLRKTFCSYQYADRKTTFVAAPKPPLLKEVARPKGATEDLQGRWLSLRSASFDIA
ncbi:MAG: hypothetical protein UIH27_05140, partial [Ruminococcus sp.]|nr:hypothetical protein [Ruminococcus sp.]